MALSTLEEAETEFNTTQQETQATSVTTASDFTNKCINIANANIECNTKMTLSLDDVSQQGATCAKIKCDSSSTANSTAETQCETTKCDPLAALEANALTTETALTICGTVYPFSCSTLYLNAKKERIKYGLQEDQCRLECKACQSKDLNTADDYNNLSKCSGTYGVGYDLAVKPSKGEAKKLQRECRKFCNGKSKLGWVQKAQLLLLGASLLNLKKTNETTGTDSTTPVVVTPTTTPTTDCALETDEKKRVICYCKDVPGYKYVDGKGCLPTTVAGSEKDPYTGSNNNTTFNADGTTSADGSTKGTGANGADSSSSGAGGGLGTTGDASPTAGLTANASNEKAKQDAKNKSMLNDSANGKIPGQVVAQAGTVAGRSSESNFVEPQKDKVASDIQKKTVGLFDSLSKFIYDKYKNGTL